MSENEIEDQQLRGVVKLFKPIRFDDSDETADRAVGKISVNKAGVVLQADSGAVFFFPMTSVHFVLFSDEPNELEE